MSKDSPFIKYYGARSKFVYYDTLQETHPDIYNRLLAEKITHSQSHSSKMLQIAQQLRAMASIEGAKEVALLKQFFSVGTLSLSPTDLYSKDMGIKIINSINTALSFKDAYKRHLTRIVGKDGKSGHAKITAAQFFADYFTKKLYALAKDRLNGLAIATMTPAQIGDELFSDEIISQALEQAFFDTEKSLKVSGDWAANDSAQGYQELFSAIENFNKDTFLSEVAKAYKLDELKMRLMESIGSSGELKDKFKHHSTAKSYIKKSLKETTLAKGTLGEIIGEKVAAAAVNGIRSTGVDVEFSSKVIGSAGGKADFIMSFDLDMSQILDVVEKHYSGREETVNAYKGLNDYLSKMDEGFVVYTNAKDYSLISDKGDGNYFFEGFSSGAPLSLGALEGVIANTPGGSAEIIGQIMSTMDGAIWSDSKGELEEELCSKMAYLLFDDVLTIGKPTAASGRAIHLTLLDGVYIPLSYLFFLMADAIEDVAQDPDDIFNVTITPGSIAYPNPPWEPGMWTAQKSKAYNQIKISAKFLKSFRDVISGIAG